jgi:hypothetical protein
VQVVESADRLAVVFLLDASDSMLPAMQESAQDAIRTAVRSMGPDDQYGLVVFGANAVPERPVSGVRELEPVRSSPVTNNTDLAEAIRLGLAMFPPDAARRLVILSEAAHRRRSRPPRSWPPQPALRSATSLSSANPCPTFR